jgi:hypothetical protein
VARGRAYDLERPDYWMPVLFSRMTGGQLWYTPGVTSDEEAPLLEAKREEVEFRFWDGLLLNIARGECTPVLGFGLLEAVIGPCEDIAGQWADRYRYPLGRADRQDLTRMAQFLAVDQQNVMVPADQLVRYLWAELLDPLAEAERLAFRKLKLPELLQETAKRRFAGTTDPFGVLAKLPFRVYLSTTPDKLLENALRACHPAKDPQVQFFPWWEEEPAPAALVELERPAKDDPKPPLLKERQGTLGRPPELRPFVYRLFGDLDEVETLVLTEDNHFDYLMAMTRAMATPEIIPAVVNRSLVTSAVLFLGFHITDWDFRVLLRSIRPQLKQQKRDRYTNVAVQIDPERERVADVSMARRYLERYLGVAGASVNIYWGTAEKFLVELNDRWAKRSGQAQAEGGGG